MKKPEDTYEPHLKARAVCLSPGAEWKPRLPGWSLIRVHDGVGYYLQAATNRDLETGTALVIASGAQGSIRASQLSGMTLQIFNIIPARLTGLITLGEERFFETASQSSDWMEQIFPPSHAVAIAMRDIVSRTKPGLLSRLKLLELFVGLFENNLEQTSPETKSDDARKRLQDFIDRTPSLELLEMNFNELAQMTHCTPRHLSRIFHELMGMSFRDKRAELRLSRARELLATTDSKILDVAMESGYRSLSLFNLMFARRFGTSPARWRNRNGQNLPAQSKIPKRPIRLAVAQQQIQARS